VVKIGFHAGFYSVVYKKIITPKKIQCIIFIKTTKLYIGEKNDIIATKKTT
jgi:hypothetical protein